MGCERLDILSYRTDQKDIENSMKLKEFIQLVRPAHWIKNIIVLFPVVFSKRYDEPATWVVAFAMMAAFCLASSFVYVVNDIHDRHADRNHPRKKNRPLAAGRISIAAARVLAAVLLVGSIVVATAVGLLANKLTVTTSVSMLPVAVLGTYLILQVAYTFWLQKAVLVDVICISLGFVLRTTAGAMAILVAVSPWLFVCTFTVCLFMGFCKRRGEITAMENSDAASHRPTLSSYTLELLTHLITLSAGVAIISYLIYATSSRTVENIGTSYLVYTLPIVTYAVFRFAMVSMDGQYTGPTELILGDRPFQLAVAAWAVATMAILLWGPDMQNWIFEHYSNSSIQGNVT